MVGATSVNMRLAVKLSTITTLRETDWQRGFLLHEVEEEILWSLFLFLFLFVAQEDPPCGCISVLAAHRKTCSQRRRVNFELAARCGDARLGGMLWSVDLTCCDSGGNTVRQSSHAERCSCQVCTAPLHMFRYPMFRHVG